MYPSLEQAYAPMVEGGQGVVIFSNNVFQEKLWSLTVLSIAELHLDTNVLILSLKLKIRHTVILMQMLTAQKTVFLTAHYL